MHKYAKATQVLPLFKNILENWQHNKVPDRIISSNFISLDRKFISHFNRFVQDYSMKQVEGLKRVLETYQQNSKL